MGFSQMCFLALLLITILISHGLAGINGEAGFDENYAITWGYDHISKLNQGEIQLSMDQSSGSGFGSKLIYGSGLFNLRIKLPSKDSGGVITAFYLTSHSDDHDELDFEFLGNREGKPITVQTNIYVNGVGDREQRFKLWFDPTADFHNYQILWNQRQIVFFVDDIPIRVYKNKKHLGVSYPRQAMQIVASLWDGDSWATDGGQTKIDWSHAPFIAQFQGFDVNGCPLSINGSVLTCYSPNYWWNTKKFWALDPSQRRAYENVKKNFVTYDYCLDKPRFSTPPPECPQ